MASKPSPVPDQLSGAFWDTARSHRLTVQRCETCGHLQHPPRHFCESCRGEELAPANVSGRGFVTTFGVVRQSPVAGYAGGAPYVFGRVELVEQDGLYLHANIHAPDPGEISIGDEVAIAWETLDDGVGLPYFTAGEHK